MFGAAVDQPGFLTLSAIGFEDLENTATISALNFTVWSYDETAPIDTELASAIDDDDTSMTAVDLASFVEGSFVLIGTEIVRIASKAGDTATVERAQKDSLAASHDADAVITLLAPRALVYGVPPTSSENPATPCPRCACRRPPACATSSRIATTRPLAATLSCA